MRVALVAQQYPPAVGGVERHVAALARGFAARGVEVEVVVCDPTGRLPRDSTEQGVLIHRFPTIANDGVYFLSPSLAIWLLRNARRFDIVHAHAYHTPVAFAGLLAARRADVPFAFTPHFHGTGHTRLRRALHVPYRPFGRVLVRRARPLLCDSNGECELLRREFGADLHASIVPNGVEVEAIRSAVPFERLEGRKLVLTAGRLESYKQADRVIEAFHRLPSNHDLVVIGDGPARPALARLVADLDLSERVDLPGFVPAPVLHRWLRTADVFVSLSLHEAFGIGVLEASVAEAGVLASDIPAHRDVASFTDPGRVQFVAPDAPLESLAAAIDAAHRHELPPEYLARVPTWDDTVALTLKAYETTVPEAREYRRSTSA
jgi:glycosyltransferase involved in cell wall biosynthesis